MLRRRFSLWGVGQTAVDAFAYLANDGTDSALGTLQVSVAGKNDTPMLTRALADHKVARNTDFFWQLPVDSFKDVDRSDTLTYSATQSNGKALPSWLKFDAATRTFSGHAPNGLGQTVDVTVTASDGHGSTSVAADTFRVSVVRPGEADGDVPPPVDCHPPTPHCNNEDDDGRNVSHSDDRWWQDGDHGSDRSVHINLGLLQASRSDWGNAPGTAGGNEASNFARWLTVDQAVAEFLAKLGNAPAALPAADLSALKQASASFLGSTTSGTLNPLSLNTSGFSNEKFRGLAEGVMKIG